MPVAFFNTMTRSVEPFRPIEEGKARLYTCGPTVHNYAHIGNFRTYAFEDLLRRYLKYRGFQVTQVMNITDVEDKIIRRHRDENKPIDEVTAPFIQAFREDLRTLNIEDAEHYPRATEYVPQMVEMVQALLDKGYAYRSDDGSVYFAIRKFPEYGKLAHFVVDELQSGARVKQDEYEKESASDFALWKAWDPEDGDVYWETALGKGRPGWHLECSTMSMQLLGEQFDIHTGGEDNIFPHHENEIAQSEATTGKKFVNYWLHSRHLLVEDAKMSKSKHNFFTLRDLTSEGAIPERAPSRWYAVRYLYISSHYRSLLNFTFDGLDAAQRTVERMYDFLRRVRELEGAPGQARAEVAQALAAARTEFEAGLDDDLNSARALAALHTFEHQCNKWMAESALLGPEARAVLEFYFDVDRVLGLKLKEATAEQSLESEIEALIQERQEARARKDFARSDAIRDQLKNMGIVLEDTAGGVRWKRALN